MVVFVVRVISAVGGYTKTCPRSTTKTKNNYSYVGLVRDVWVVRVVWVVRRQKSSYSSSDLHHAVYPELAFLRRQANKRRDLDTSTIR